MASACHPFPTVLAAPQSLTGESELVNRKNIDELNCESPKISPPSDSSTSCTGLDSWVTCNFSVSKWSIWVYKKVSSGWISDISKLFFAMISRLEMFGTMNWLPFQSVFPNNPSPASNALVLIGSQVLRSDGAKLHASSRFQISLKKIDFLQCPFLIFIIFLVSDVFVKQRHIHVATHALLLFDVRNLIRPGWTHLTVNTCQNKLDVP